MNPVTWTALAPAQHEESGMFPMRVLKNGDAVLRKQRDEIFITIPLLWHTGEMLEKKPIHSSPLTRRPSHAPRQLSVFADFISSWTCSQESLAYDCGVMSMWRYEKVGGTVLH